MTRTDTFTRHVVRDLAALRSQHPAWVVLASRRGALILGCIQGLLRQDARQIPWEDAVQQVAGALEQFAHQEEFGIELDGADAALVLARRELRDWIQRRLLVERADVLLPTSALQQALQFTAGLTERFMTSTASRLATVQRSIRELEVALSPDAQQRAAHLRARISELEQELQDVEGGRFEVLSGERAQESVREVYQLAMSLPSDIRRVEDSWRQAERVLRQRIVSEQQHRGQVLNQLLDSHEELLRTPEGQVFQAFHEQLTLEAPLRTMREGILGILRHPAAQEALGLQQRSDLRWLVPRLVSESRGVIDARARSERDVRGFMLSGLAAEHHRVGQLLQQVLDAAARIDWAPAALRRQAMPLPPVAGMLAQGQHGIRPVDRLVYGAPDDLARAALDLQPQQARLDDLEDDFWEAFDSFDEAGWLVQTSDLLQAHPDGLSLPALARLLPPTHDLQTLVLWVSVAEPPGVDPPEFRDELLLRPREGAWLRFDLPHRVLTPSAVAAALEDSRQAVAVEEPSRA